MIFSVYLLSLHTFSHTLSPSPVLTLSTNVTFSSLTLWYASWNCMSLFKVPRKGKKERKMEPTFSHALCISEVPFPICLVNNNNNNILLFQNFRFLHFHEDHHYRRVGSRLGSPRGPWKEKHKTQNTNQRRISNSPPRQSWEATLSSPLTVNTDRISLAHFTLLAIVQNKNRGHSGVQAES